jgi:hypothetical protein
MRAKQEDQDDMNVSDKETIGLWAVVFLLAGLVLLLLSIVIKGMVPLNELVNQIAMQLGATLFTIGLISWVYDKHVREQERRTLARNLARIPKDALCQKLWLMGATDVSPNRTKLEEEYSTRLSEAKSQIDICGLHLLSFKRRPGVKQSLTKLLEDNLPKERPVQIRIVMLDPEGPVAEQRVELAKRIGHKEQNLPGNIKEATEFFQQIQALPGGREMMKIGYAMTTPTCFMLRVDEVIWVQSYPPVEFGAELYHFPLLKLRSFREGESKEDIAFEFYQEYFKTIWKCSRSVPPSETLE